MDNYVVPVLLVSLVCAALGGILSRKAMKNGKLLPLVISIILAVLCLFGIIFAAVVIIF